MRELTSHKVNGLNEAIKIKVLDEPGQGNACHDYLIVANDGPSFPDSAREDARLKANCKIHFQNGPIGEAGINGVSNESILAVVEDRLIGFQSGQYACRENAIALTKIQEAMHWLKHRTEDRVNRGVEGSHKK